MTPTSEQVTRFASELHTKYDRIPGMKARIDRGAALALAGDVRPNQSGYKVLSSANDGTGYPIAPGGRCCCPDSAHGAPVVRGIPTCKHSIAYNIFHRALVETLAARILSNDYGNRRLQYAHPNTYLLLTPPATRGASASLRSDRSGRLANVRWSSPLNTLVPVTPADMVAVEKWLDQAHALPANAMIDLATADTVARYDEIYAEWKPTMTQKQWRQWQETGDTPIQQHLDALTAS